MIDFDDVDDSATMGMFMSGPSAVICLIVTVVLLCYALSNDEDCKKKTCPNQSVPTLQNHSCQCIIEAK
jgi:hypothetical protein